MKTLKTWALIVSVTWGALYVLSGIPRPEPVNPVKMFQVRCESEGGKYLYVEDHLCIKP